MQPFKKIRMGKPPAEQVHSAISEKLAEMKQAMAVLNAVNESVEDLPVWLQWVLLQVIHEIEDWRGSTLIVPSSPHPETVERADP